MWRRVLLFGQTKPIDCKLLVIISIEAVFGAGFGGTWVVFGLSKTLGAWRVTAGARIRYQDSIAGVGQVAWWLE
jgi:hypothetical protein